MSRFIDMDKLVLPKGTVDEIQKKGVPAILDWLAEQKSIEVVRCKDCTYGIENGELCGQKVYLCSAVTNPNEFYGDFYCKSGERRETE